MKLFIDYFLFDEVFLNMSNEDFLVNIGDCTENKIFSDLISAALSPICDCLSFDGDSWSNNPSLLSCIGSSQLFDSYSFNKLSISGFDSLQNRFPLFSSFVSPQKSLSDSDNDELIPWLFLFIVSNFRLAMLSLLSKESSFRTCLILFEWPINKEVLIVLVIPSVVGRLLMRFSFFGIFNSKKFFLSVSEAVEEFRNVWYDFDQMLFI